MLVDVFNLIAAVLCSVGAGAGFVVAWLSPPSPVIQWALWSAGMGTLGCLVWAVASLISIVNGCVDERISDPGHVDVLAGYGLVGGRVYDPADA